MADNERKRAVLAAIDGEMRLVDPEVRAVPARVLELLDPEFTEIGASGRRWDVESVLTVTSGGSVSAESPVRVSETRCLTHLGGPGFKTLGKCRRGRGRR